MTQAVPSRDAQCINFDGIIKDRFFCFSFCHLQHVGSCSEACPFWPQNDIRCYIIKLKRRNNFLPRAYYYHLGETSAGKPLVGCLSCVWPKLLHTLTHKPVFGKGIGMAITGTNQYHWGLRFQVFKWQVIVKYS